MARFSSIEVLNLQMDVEAALEFGQLILQRNCIEIVEREGASIVGRQGSQLFTRLLGGWFVPLGSLPKRVAVTVEAAGDRAQLTLSVEETLGFYFFGKRLYQRYSMFAESLLADMTLAAGEKRVDA